MEDLLFERLERMDIRVAPEVVLQDLWFVDRIVRPLVGPDDPDYRVPWLVETLEARRFCSTAEACWEVIDLYDDLVELFDIRTYSGLDAVLDRYREYAADDASAVDR